MSTLLTLKLSICLHELFSSHNDLKLLNLITGNILHNYVIVIPNQPLHKTNVSFMLENSPLKSKVLN